MRTPIINFAISKDHILTIGTEDVGNKKTDDLGY